MSTDFDENLILVFIQEAKEHLATIEPDLLALEKEVEACSPQTINRVFRAIHTIKGGAGMLDLAAIAALTHAMENVLVKVRDGTIKPRAPLIDLLFLCIDKLKVMVDDTGNSNNVDVAHEISQLNTFQPVGSLQNGEAPCTQGFSLFSEENAHPPEALAALKTPTTPFAPGEQLVAAVKPLVPPVPSENKAAAQRGSGDTETIRVKVDLLNRLINTAGELVLGRNQLLSTFGQVAEQSHETATILQNIDRITVQLQEEVMQTRMQPIGSLFSRFSRMVRDLGKNLGKEIELITEGGNVELDKSILELLADPLTHIVRNSVDHGIEKIDERRGRGKPQKATIIFKAFHEGGRVHVVVADDGKGIHTDNVLTKAIEKGLIDAAKAKTMSEKEIVSLIFAPGFSTAEVVSDVSGRGVGMDVVRTNIEKLSGSVEVNTVAGSGTTVVISLPLTVAIIPALIVKAAGQLFAVPQSNLVELVCVKVADIAERIVKISNAPILKLRGSLLPVIKLAEVLNMEKVYEEPFTGRIKPDRRRNIADRRGIDADVKSSRRADHAAYPQRINPDRRQHWHSDYYILILSSGNNRFGLIVDELFDTQEVVVKPISSFIQKAKCFSGATIMGNGQVIMIVDTTGIVRLAQLKFVEHSAAELAPNISDLKRGESKAIILFNGAADEMFALAQEKILRIERVAASALQTVGRKEYLSEDNHTTEIIRLEKHLPVSPMPAEQNELYLIIPRSAAGSAGLGSHFGILASHIIDAAHTEVNLQKSDIAHPAVLGHLIHNEKLVIFLDPHGFYPALTTEQTDSSQLNVTQ